MQGLIDMRPIPKRLLIHSIEYHKRIKDSRYGEGYEDPVTINFVRIEISYNVKKSASNEEKLFKGLLFIDAVNSSPMIEPKKESKITFDEGNEKREMFVQNVKPIYGFKFHHYEVELVW